MNILLYISFMYVDIIIIIIIYDENKIYFTGLDFIFIFNYTSRHNVYSISNNKIIVSETK
jgi:hypothetical protein